MHAHRHKDTKMYMHTLTRAQVSIMQDKHAEGYKQAVRAHSTKPPTPNPRAFPTTSLDSMISLD